MNELPRDKPIVVYCRSGRRSAMAKEILEKAGFADVTNGGGLSDMPKSPKGSGTDRPSFTKN